MVTPRRACGASSSIVTQQSPLIVGPGDGGLAHRHPCRALTFYSSIIYMYMVMIVTIVAVLGELWAARACPLGIITIVACVTGTAAATVSNPGHLREWEWASWIAPLLDSCTSPAEFAPVTSADAEPAGECSRPVESAVVFWPRR